MPSDVLPYAADVNDSLPPAELHVLRQQYNDEQARGHLSVQTRFNLAWGLVKSTLKEETEEGVLLLMDIYREEPSRRRECLYYLGLGQFKLGNYDEARRYNNLLLDREPSNLQAKSLSGLIEREVSKEGYIGMSLLGGAAIVAGSLAWALMKKPQHR